MIIKGIGKERVKKEGSKEEKGEVVMMKRETINRDKQKRGRKGGEVWKC